MNAFNIVLEVDDITRFTDVKNKQRSSKDGNKYLKMVFSDAAIHSVQYYPVIKKFYNSLVRKKINR